jgi:hypothetical protein
VIVCAVEQVAEPVQDDVELRRAGRRLAPVVLFIDRSPTIDIGLLASFKVFRSKRAPKMALSLANTRWPVRV